MENPGSPSRKTRIARANLAKRPQRQADQHQHGSLDQQVYSDDYAKHPYRIAGPAGSDKEGRGYAEQS